MYPYISNADVTVSKFTAQISNINIISGIISLISYFLGFKCTNFKKSNKLNKENRIQKKNKKETHDAMKNK